MSSSAEKGLVLIAGATGGIGFHTVKALLNEGYQVRIISRSVERAKEVFGDEFSKIESVYTSDIVTDISKKIQGGYDTYLRSAFTDPAIGTGAKVKYVISTIGAGRKTQNPQYLDYLFNKHLIDLAQEFNVKKFIYISACFITRPYSIVAYVLNSIFNNVMGFKLQIENYLRTSGLSYIIIRPPKLKQYQDSPTTAFRISQGDQLSFYNKIKRGTVGRLTVQALMSASLPSKVTFECYSTSEDLGKPFSWSENNTKMLLPDENDIIDGVDHVTATRRIRIGLRLLTSTLVLTAGAFLAKKFVLKNK